MRLTHRARCGIVLGSGGRGNQIGLLGEAMPDIAIAEIPVDEAERPLPAPEPAARNALVDGPILRTLLWLAWPNVIALAPRPAW
jgi:hypothetical protein